MKLLDSSIEARGFAPHCMAVAVRTAAACVGMRYRPDFRAVCCIGLLLVEPDEQGGFRFQPQVRSLQNRETPTDLLDWLEDLFPSTGAIVSYDMWGSIPWRLRAIADPHRHPRIRAAAWDTDERWRDLAKADAWYLRPGRAPGLPCICPAGQQVADCNSALPFALLPSTKRMEQELIREAAAGWQAWARIFHIFDQPGPADDALKAFTRWQQANPIGDDI